MKVTIKNDAKLKKVLKTIKRFIPSRVGNPAYSAVGINVVCKPDDDVRYLTFKVMHWNADMDIEFPIIDADSSGMIDVPGRLFCDIASQSTSDTITLEEYPDGSVVLEDKNRKYKLLKYDFNRSTYEWTLGPESFCFNLNTKEFVDSINAVKFASAVDESRAIINSVLFEIKTLGDGCRQLRIAATDTHRLAVKTIKLAYPDIRTKDSENIIPLGSIKQLMKIIPSDDKAFVRIAFHYNGMMINLIGGGMMLSFACKCIQTGDFQSYPKFDRAIPTEEPKTTLHIDRKTFVSALRRLSMVQASNNRITFNSHTNHSTLDVVADGDVCEALEIIPLINKSGEGAEVSFNSKYLLDFLNAVDTDVVTFELAGSEGRTGTFRPTRQNDYFNLIMGMSTY